MKLTEHETLVTYPIGFETNQEMVARNKKGIPYPTFSFVIVGNDLEEYDNN